MSKGVVSRIEVCFSYLIKWLVISIFWFQPKGDLILCDPVVHHGTKFLKMATKYALNPVLMTTALFASKIQ